MSDNKKNEKKERKKVKKKYYLGKGKKEGYFDKNDVSGFVSPTKKHWEDRRDYICPCGSSLITYIRTYKYVKSQVRAEKLIRCVCPRSSYFLYVPE